MQKNVEYTKAEKIDSIILTNAVANFECIVKGRLESGDHVIYAGEVVASYMHDTLHERIYTKAPGYVVGGIV